MRLEKKGRHARRMSPKSRLALQLNHRCAGGRVSHYKSKKTKKIQNDFIDGVHDSRPSDPLRPGGLQIHCRPRDPAQEEGGQLLNHHKKKDEEAGYLVRGRSEVLVVDVVRGFVYHCFDDGGDLYLHPCCTMNLPEHDNG
jgi:hypothetical protein